MVTTYRQAMTTDANTGSGTSNGTVFLMDSTMPSGTDETTVRYLKYNECFKSSCSKVGLKIRKQLDLKHCKYLLNTHNEFTFFRDLILSQYKNDWHRYWLFPYLLHQVSMLVS